MKKLLLIPLAFIAFAMSSCQKDEMPTEPALPEPTTEAGLVTYGTACTQPIWHEASKQFYPCGSKFCVNRSHEICSFCGYSKRVSPGCVCDNSGPGTGNPGDPGNSYTKPPGTVDFADDVEFPIRREVWYRPQPFYFQLVRWNTSGYTALSVRPGESLNLDTMNGKIRYTFYDGDGTLMVEVLQPNSIPSERINNYFFDINGTGHYFSLTFITTP